VTKRIRKAAPAARAAAATSEEKDGPSPTTRQQLDAIPISKSQYELAVRLDQAVAIATRERDAVLQAIAAGQGYEPGTYQVVNLSPTKKSGGFQMQIMRQVDVAPGT
jgi:hypothetical protein